VGTSALPLSLIGYCSYQSAVTPVTKIRTVQSSFRLVLWHINLRVYERGGWRIQLILSTLRGTSEFLTISCVAGDHRSRCSWKTVRPSLSQVCRCRLPAGKDGGCTASTPAGESERTRFQSQEDRQEVQVAHGCSQIMLGS